MTPARLLVAALGALALAAAAPASRAQAPDFTRLVREEGRAVVNISRYTPPAAREGAEEESVLELLKRFFGSEPAEAEGRSLGSGFLISADGYLITNAHLVLGAQLQDVRVRLADKREFDGRVVGYDRYTDIALLKIDASGLPYVRIGDPEALQVGEWVVAIGSPFGLERSVTAGIVSAKGRSLPDESYVPFLQTDVAVNPGNSGGPLFNLKGEVVGVNSLIYSGTGGYMGLSFAIPIDVAVDVAKQLKAQGRVTRGRIGVHMQEISAELARALRLPRPYGALITELDEGGPAERAGLRPGDVVVAFEGKPVEMPADLAQFTARAKPGSAVELRIVRRGVASALRVRVADAAIVERAAVVEPAAVAPDLARLGLRLAPLSAEQRERYLTSTGVLVQRAEGAAQRAGLQRGDLIVSLNGEEIDSVETFRQLAAKAGGDTVALLVQRGGGRLFVPLRIP